MGSTLVSYLRGAREGASRTVEVTTAKAAAGSMTGALWLAATAAVGAAAAATVGVVAAAVGAAAAATVGVGSGLGFDPPAGGGEEWGT